MARCRACAGTRGRRTRAEQSRARARTGACSIPDRHRSVLQDVGERAGFPAARAVGGMALGGRLLEEVGEGVAHVSVIPLSAGPCRPRAPSGKESKNRGRPAPAGAGSLPPTRSGHYRQRSRKGARRRGATRGRDATRRPAWTTASQRRTGPRERRGPEHCISRTCRLRPPRRRRGLGAVGFSGRPSSRRWRRCSHRPR